MIGHHGPHYSDHGESPGCREGCIVLLVIAAIIVLIVAVGYCRTAEREEPPTARYEYNQQSLTLLARSKHITQESWVDE